MEEEKLTRGIGELEEIARGQEVKGNSGDETCSQEESDFCEDDFRELMDGIEIIKFIDDVCDQGAHTDNTYGFALMVEGLVKKSIVNFDNVMRSLASRIEGLEYRWGG